MIPNKIKDLFQFIDYLHSNIENFNQYNDLLKELRELDKKRNQLNKNESFKDKLEYEKIQNEISQKFDILKQNVIHRITSKANDLKLLDNNRNANELTLSYKDITTLKEKVQPENLNEISEHKNKYLEFRKQTNKENYLSFGFLFTDLDEYIVDLFSFFSEDKNEFDFIIPVQTHFIGGNSESKTRIWNRLADVFYFQIYFETENGKVKNNDSILTPKNWEQHKDTFFKQRMETHPDSYEQDEKIKLELEGLEKLTINKTDYKILKERYRKHLINKTDEPVQETPQFSFVNNFDFVYSNEVYSYFYEKLVSKRMLNEKDLQEYLIQAFQECTPPNKLFRLKNIPTKHNVNKIFYNYFKDVAQKPHGKRKNYAELLGKYFEGFKTENVMTNWSK